VRLFVLPAHGELKWHAVCHAEQPLAGWMIDHLGRHATWRASGAVCMSEGGCMDLPSDDEFAEFMLGRWSGLVRFGYGLTGDLGFAEDLAQTALTRACASWPRVRRADNPDAYVRKIMINSNRSRLRKRRVTEVLTESPPDLAPSRPANGQDGRPELIAALQRLPTGQRAVVVLRYWMDLTEAETAAALGCSVGNVKSQAARALAKLRMSADLVDGVSHGDR
jgi:RNA polymerase sigma-70 factor (sigma-E family)